MKEDFFSLANLRQALIALIQKYHPFNIRYFKALVGVMMTLLMGTVLILGWLSSVKVKETVTEDFNQQQLVIARHAASQIENRLEALKRELFLLSLSPSIQYAESAWMCNRMEIAFSSIREEGTIEIRFVQDGIQKTFHVLGEHDCNPGTPDKKELDHLEWAKKETNKGHILLTSVSPIAQEDRSLRPIMEIAIPVWQGSVDQSHPVALNNFSGVLLFTIDLSILMGTVTKEIRSGKTGYSWIIDENGTFLYHQEKSFIGQNAFEARKGKKPTISFDRINQIQKDKMLKGEEGTSWYISGWHRGMEGEIKKLIAYTPIRLDDTKSRIWSVAVVAPVSEVAGAIHAIQIRQFSLQTIIFFVILFGGLFVNFMILSWSNTLEQEVTKKTIELKKSEQRYRSLVENAEDIIFTVDYNGNFISINKYGANFFNRTEEDVIGHNASEFFTWPSSEVLILMIQNVFDSKESKQITHMVIIGDRQHWFNTNFRRLWDEAGNIYAVLGISRDVTERKQMEEHSFYTEKLASMGTLAAGVAHEINNPLGVILGFTELLLEKFPTDSEEYDLLKTIENQGLNAKRVIENLLNFARHKEHAEEIIDVNKNLQTVLSVMNNTLLLNKISVKQDLQENLPLIIADSGELQQVFFNIINNAIYAMKDGGSLTITTKAINGENVGIRIADTGHGIKQEHHKRIFDPLFTTKEVGKGTGLGLSVSYGIVTKHRGTITFESKTKEESEQPGTTFIITFPAAEKLKGEQ
ncbi:MAG: ATP-binding protein [Thermodesulfovibrionales bacterium]